jgi:hypothetical protein
VKLTPLQGTYGTQSTASATFPNLPQGSYVASFTYSGDANWLAAGNVLVWPVEVAPGAKLASSTTTFDAVTVPTASGGTGFELTTTVTGAGNTRVAPTGFVYIYDGGELFTYVQLPVDTKDVAPSVTIGLSDSAFLNDGKNQLTAIYLGDKNYLPSTSSTVSIDSTNAEGDFSMMAQVPQIALVQGSSSTGGISLAAELGFNASVALTCQASSPTFSCSVAPGSVALQGTGHATVTINATIPGASATAVKRAAGGQRTWLEDRGRGRLALAFALLMPVFGLRRRWKGRMGGKVLMLALVGWVLTAAVAGCGGGGTTTQPPPPPPANLTPVGTYTVVVTGTGNGVVHNVKLSVVVSAM